MKKSIMMYAGFSILGIGMMIGSFLLDGAVPDTIGGMLMGIGAGLFGISVASGLARHMEVKNPARMRQSQIEANDERNISIRRQAQAVAGKALQWTVLAAAWVSIGFGAPLWLTLAAVAVFVLKSLLEVYLMTHYQKTM